MMKCWRAVLLAFLFLVPALATAQDGFDFWISESLLKTIVEGKSLVVPLKVSLGERSDVHKLKNDCEIHVAAVPATLITAPRSWVVEPPYLCIAENKPPTAGMTWEKFFDQHFIGQDNCTVEGFPRILDEHLHGDEFPSNPHHAFEIHPALRITCGDTTTDFSKFLGHHVGMSEIQPASAASCFNMEVRIRRNKAKKRYELQVDRPKKCGNFVSYEMSIFSEWIRAVDSSNPTTGHSAIARVNPAGFDGSRTVKIYTLPGTKEDELLAQWKEEWESTEEEPHHGGFFHGLTTIDYFALWKTVTDENGAQLAVNDWTTVKFPLAVIIFGTLVDPDPEVDEGEEFD